MNLIHTDNPVNRVIDSFFNSSLSDILGTEFTHNHPSANIIENKNDFEINLAVPGFNKSDFNIEIKKDKLIITSKVLDIKKSENESIDQYTRKEYDYKRFKRSFHLPKTIDTENISAQYQDGILKIKADKKEATAEPSKRIEIS